MNITQELLTERKHFLINRDYSQNTIENYNSDLKLFLNYIKIENRIHTVDHTQITNVNIEKRKTYLSELKTPRNSIYYMVRPTISPSTIQSKIVAIKSFLKFLNVIYDC